MSATAAVIPAPGGRLTYPREFLLKLQHSPLVKKPDNLPNVAELMSAARPPPHTAKSNDSDPAHSKAHPSGKGEASKDQYENGSTPSTENARSARPKSGTSSLPRTGEKTLVFGPPKMNFASAQSGKNQSASDSLESPKTPTGKGPDEFPRPPKYSVAERMAARQPATPKSKEPREGPSAEEGLKRSLSDRNGARSERPERGERPERADKGEMSERLVRTTDRPIGGRQDRERSEKVERGERPERTDREREGEKIERPTSGYTGVPRSRADDSGSWRARTEAARQSRATADGRASGSDSRTMGTGRRTGRDQQPEWMSADNDKLKLDTTPTGASFEASTAPSGAAVEDDIQRFKTQMRNRERMARGEPIEAAPPRPSNARTNSNNSVQQAMNVQAQPTPDKKSESVDAFFDMGFDFGKVDVARLFEEAREESHQSAAVGPPASGKSRFARFFSEEPDQTVHADTMIDSRQFMQAPLPNRQNGGPQGLPRQLSQAIPPQHDSLANAHMQRIDINNLFGAAAGPSAISPAGTNYSGSSNPNQPPRHALSEEDVLSRYRAKQRSEHFTEDDLIASLKAQGNVAHGQQQQRQQHGHQGQQQQQQLQLQQQRRLPQAMSQLPLQQQQQQQQPRPGMHGDDAMSSGHPGHRIPISERDLFREMQSGFRAGPMPDRGRDSSHLHNIDQRVLQHPSQQGRGNPSEEDKVGINRVMEKLAFFGMGQPSHLSEDSSQVYGNHMQNNRPDQNYNRPPLNSGPGHGPHVPSPGHMRAPPPPSSHAGHLPSQGPPHAGQRQQHMGAHPRQQHTASQVPPPHNGPMYNDRSSPMPPHSMYRSAVSMGLPDDPSTQLTAMIQAASKAKQNHQNPSVAAMEGMRGMRGGMDLPDFMGGPGKSYALLNLALGVF
ncbi:hypothetical protein DFS34DRAFT_97134 [Phlyctochytrium arcticum]|nr:hypothetical protein DFS34DRAFT_97134 [Phlyctochytrium arcticum]